MNLRYIPLHEINPFDGSHRPVYLSTPGFYVKTDERTREHQEGAELCCDIIRRGGSLIRPIAVCDSSLVPPDRDWRSTKPWQRLDGFKRYWGHRLAGATEIACEVIDRYEPGCQRDQSMTVEERDVGKILQVLARSEYDPTKWPYQGRIQIEDCETVHVHIGHLRMEFTKDQFIEVAAKFTEAARLLVARRGP